MNSKVRQEMTENLRWEHVKSGRPSVFKYSLIDRISIRRRLEFRFKLLGHSRLIAIFPFSSAPTLFHVESEMRSNGLEDLDGE